MIDSAQQQLVAELARDVVARAAPNELPLFRPISGAYFANPDRPPKQKGSRDDMLGFGVADGMTLLTPFVLPVAQAIVGLLMQEARKAVQKESGPLVEAWVRSAFRKLRPSEPSPDAATLSQEQLARVRAVALARARQLELPADKAELLADAVVGGLVAVPA